MQRPKRTTPKIYDPAYMTYSLEVSGEVLDPIILSANDLAAMELTEVCAFSMIRNRRDDISIQDCRGVRLTEILQLAEVLMRTSSNGRRLRRRRRVPVGQELRTQDQHTESSTRSYAAQITFRS